MHGRRRAQQRAGIPVGGEVQQRPRLVAQIVVGTVQALRSIVEDHPLDLRYSCGVEPGFWWRVQ